VKNSHRLVHQLVDCGDVANSGRHMTRLGARILASYHPDAPHGMSACGVCARTVLRGMGRWWESIW
jgi:hypothetical protein